jgi:hypothetical protein
MTDAATRTAPDGSPMSKADLLREQRLQRNLKIAIAAMGLMILAGLGLIAYKILTESGSSTSGAGPVTAIAGVPGGEIGVELPKGAKVVSVSVSGNRLAIHHESQAGTGIAIIDVDTGRRIADVKPLEAVPRN